MYKSIDDAQLFGISDGEMMVPFIELERAGA